MKKLVFFIIFFVALSAIYLIDKYKNNQLDRLVDVATYFQDPSRHLLKSTYLFDEALSNINRFNHTKNELYLIKAKALLLASKGFINKNCYLKYEKIDEVINITNDLVLKIEQNEAIINTAEIMQKHHYMMEKVSFQQWKQSIRFFEMYQKDTISFYNIAYVVLLIIIVLMFFSIAFIYQIQEKNKIKLLSETDHLTKAFNRRKFFDEIKDLKEVYSIIMFDIDFFKKINDTYGHEKGDFVLKKLVQDIQSYIRKDDMVFRWGGEEFFILFKNSRVNDIVNIAEKIRENVEKDDFDNLSLTISLSVAEVKNMDIEEVIKELDDALYESKQNGRNRVTIVKV
jgi:diguanylate cyclase (GGDEF)-like protein